LEIQLGSAVRSVTDPCDYPSSFHQPASPAANERLLTKPLEFPTLGGGPRWNLHGDLYHSLGGRFDLYV